MNEPNNPAGRLRFWLEQFREQTGSHPALGTWCLLWELDQETVEGRAECLRRGHDLMMLSTRVRALAEASSNPAAAGSLKRFNQIDESLNNFTVLSGVNVATMMSPIKADGWLALETLDGLLSFESAEPVVAEDERVSLLEKTQNLIRDVLDDDSLDDDTKKQIVEELRSVEDALIRVTLTGANGLDHAANGLAGVMLRLFMHGADIAKHPVTQSVFGLVFAIDLALNMGANYFELASGPLGQMLGLDPSSPPATFDLPAIEPPVNPAP